MRLSSAHCRVYYIACARGYYLWCVYFYFCSAGHPIGNDYKYGGELSLSTFPQPIPQLDGYEKMAWCPQCVSGERNTHYVSTEDRQATSIWLHALRYTSTDPRYSWTFASPRPSWAISSPTSIDTTLHCITSHHAILQHMIQLMTSLVIVM